MRGILAVELHRTTFRYIGPLFGVMGAVVGVLNSYPSIATWPNVSDVMLGVSHFLAPFVAGVAAWEALRSSRRHMQAMERTSALPAPWIHLPQLLAALVWVSASWIIACAVVVIRASVVGLYGVPETITLLHTLLLPLVFVVVGMSLADLISTWIAVPLSVSLAVALYGFTLFGGLPNFVSWTNIFAGFVVVDGTVSNQVYFLALLIEAFAVAVLFAVFTALRYRPFRFVATLTGVIGISVLVGGAGLAISQQGEESQQIAEDSLPMVTIRAKSGLVEMRVLEQYAPEADRLRAVWSRIASLFEDSELAFTALDQRVDLDHLNAPRGFERLYLNPGSHEIAEESVQSSLYDVLACYRDEGAQPRGDFGVEGTVVLEAWLEGRTDLGSASWTSNPDVPAALAWLNGLSDANAREWVTAHTAQITSCTWERDDFRAA